MGKKYQAVMPLGAFGAGHVLLQISSKKRKKANQEGRSGKRGRIKIERSKKGNGVEADLSGDEKRAERGSPSSRRGGKTYGMLA